MADLVVQLNEKLADLRAVLDGIPQLAPLDEAEKAAKVPKEILVSVVGVITTAIIMMVLGLGSVCALVGFGFPAYRSFHAIETKTKDDDKQWLIYWVIYAFFHCCETFIDVLLYWIPFYFAFKLAFLLWAMLPQTKGAMFLYESFLRDFLRSHENQFDDALENAKKNAGVVAGEAVAAATDVVEEIGEEIAHEIVDHQRRRSSAAAIKRASVASVASRKSSIASEKAEVEEEVVAEEEEEVAAEEEEVAAEEEEVEERKSSIVAEAAVEEENKEA